MILLDFYFLGLTYIIVYVGAIMILFLFVIMMVQIQVLPTGQSEPTYMTAAIDISGNPSAWWINIIRGIILLGGVIMIGIWSPNGVTPTSWDQDSTSLVNYFYPAWTTEFKTMTDLETLANLLYLGYPTALILIGIALWVVMIGIIKVTTPD